MKIRLFLIGVLFMASLIVRASVHAVDLGLPSGLQWATCNVGADFPTEVGNYYAWGETTPKNYYDWSNYKYRQNELLTKYCTKSKHGKVDNIRVLESSDDVATVEWGDSWRMPTSEEWDELRHNCTWKWYKSYHDSAVMGFEAEGPNGEHIFFPVTGGKNHEFFGTFNDQAYYWLSSLAAVNTNRAYTVNISWDKDEGVVRALCESYPRYCGFPVRPVRKQ